MIVEFTQQTNCLKLKQVMRLIQSGDNDLGFMMKQCFKKAAADYDDDDDFENRQHFHCINLI